jgi:hypothetical protein
VPIGKSKTFFFKKKRENGLQNHFEYYFIGKLTSYATKVGKKYWEMQEIDHLYERGELNWSLLITL